MTDFDVIMREKLELYKQSIRVAKEGLRLLADKDPIAKATLEEMFKISKKIDKK
tara:strand:+ start:183 stop:344 length:162 start_codon:yes stop_codon:yes gene_type:complete